MSFSIYKPSSLLLTQPMSALTSIQYHNETGDLHFYFSNTSQKITLKITEHEENGEDIKVLQSPKMERAESVNIEQELICTTPFGGDHDHKQEETSPLLHVSSGTKILVDFVPLEHLEKKKTEENKTLETTTSSNATSISSYNDINYVTPDRKTNPINVSPKRIKRAKMEEDLKNI